MADVEANRALAEAYIAKHLGFSMEELQDRTRPLTPPRMANVRFKRYGNQVDDKVRASAIIAMRAAAALVWAIGDNLPPLRRKSARDVRDAILRESQYVDLDSLLAFCWESGVPVLQLDRTPAGNKRFDGMAAYAERHPVIVLASGRDSPPWLAFYIAHELGHIMLEHVRADTGAWFDVRIDSAVHSEDERSADRFACEVLSGFSEPVIRDLKLRAHPLAIEAARLGPAQGVDPGVFALIYARSNNRWAVAQEVLKYLGLGAGGQGKIAQRLADYLSRVELPEAEERFLRVLATG